MVDGSSEEKVAWMSDEERFHVREACRRGVGLDGTDSKMLEHALTQVEQERDEALGRLRKTAQTLIQEVGADGPMDAEDAARKAVAALDESRAESERLRDELEDKQLMLEEIFGSGLTHREHVEQIILAVKHCNEEEDEHGMCSCAHVIAEALAVKDNAAERLREWSESAMCAVAKHASPAVWQKLHDALEGKESGR